MLVCGFYYMPGAGIVWLNSGRSNRSSEHSKAACAAWLGDRTDRGRFGHGQGPAGLGAQGGSTRYSARSSQLRGRMYTILEDGKIQFTDICEDCRLRKGPNKTTFAPVEP